MNQITVNHLTTKLDYADFKCGAAKAAIKKRDILILKIIASILILTNLRREVFYSNSIYRGVPVLFAIILCWYENIVYYVVRRRASRYFEANKEKFFAQITAFYKDQITFKTDRYSAAIPYDLLYKVYEDDRVFIIYTAIDEMRFIPKRAISEEECTQIRNIIQTKLQEKYQQEGVR